MPIESHPKFAEWKAASDKLNETRLAVERKEAGKVELSLAQMEYDKISREIDDA